MSQLETERLRLAPLSGADYAALSESEAAFAACFGTPAEAGLQDFIAPDDVSDDFQAMMSTEPGVDPWRWGFALIDKSCWRVIGTVGFKGPPDPSGAVEIAYAVVPSMVNRGFATEAARQLVLFAKADSRVQTILAHTLPEENASTRVLGKLGFEKLGEVTDPDDGRVWRWVYSGD